MIETAPKREDQKEEGWLWHMAGKGKMSEKEMMEWEMEGRSLILYLVYETLIALPFPSYR